MTFKDLKSNLENFKKHHSINEKRVLLGEDNLFENLLNQISLENFFNSREVLTDDFDLQQILIHLAVASRRKQSETLISENENKTARSEVLIPEQPFRLVNREEVQQIHYERDVTGSKDEWNKVFGKKKKFRQLFKLEKLRYLAELNLIVISTAKNSWSEVFIKREGFVLALQFFDATHCGHDLTFDLNPSSTVLLEIFLKYNPSILSNLLDQSLLNATVIINSDSFIRSMLILQIEKHAPVIQINLIMIDENKPIIKQVTDQILDQLDLKSLELNLQRESDSPEEILQSVKSQIKRPLLIFLSGFAYIQQQSQAEIKSFLKSIKGLDLKLVFFVESPLSFYELALEVELDPKLSIVETINLPSGLVKELIGSIIISNLYVILSPETLHLLPSLYANYYSSFVENLKGIYRADYPDVPHELLIPYLAVFKKMTLTLPQEISQPSNLQNVNLSTQRKISLFHGLNLESIQLLEYLILIFRNKLEGRKPNDDFLSRDTLKNCFVYFEELEKDSLSVFQELSVKLPLFTVNRYGFMFTSETILNSILVNLQELEIKDSELKLFEFLDLVNLYFQLIEKNQQIFEPNRDVINQATLDQEQLVYLIKARSGFIDLQPEMTNIVYLQVLLLMEGEPLNIDLLKLTTENQWVITNDLVSKFNKLITSHEENKSFLEKRAVTILNTISVNSQYLAFPELFLPFLRFLPSQERRSIFDLVFNPNLEIKGPQILNSLIELVQQSYSEITSSNQFSLYNRLLVYSSNMLLSPVRKYHRLLYYKIASIDLEVSFDQLIFSHLLQFLLFEVGDNKSTLADDLSELIMSNYPKESALLQNLSVLKPLEPIIPRHDFTVVRLILNSSKLEQGFSSLKELANYLVSTPSTLVKMIADLQFKNSKDTTYSSISEIVLDIFKVEIGVLGELIDKLNLLNLINLYLIEDSRKLREIYALLVIGLSFKRLTVDDFLFLVTELSENLLPLIHESSTFYPQTLVHLRKIRTQNYLELITDLTEWVDKQNLSEIQLKTVLNLTKLIVEGLLNKKSLGYELLSSLRRYRSNKPVIIKTKILIFKLVSKTLEMKINLDDTYNSFLFIGYLGEPKSKCELLLNVSPDLYHLLINLNDFEKFIENYCLPLELHSEIYSTLMFSKFVTENHLITVSNQKEEILSYWFSEFDKVADPERGYPILSVLLTIKIFSLYLTGIKSSKPEKHLINLLYVLNHAFSNWRNPNGVKIIETLENLEIRSDDNQIEKIAFSTTFLSLRDHITGIIPLLTETDLTQIVTFLSNNHYEIFSLFEDFIHNAYKQYPDNPQMHASYLKLTEQKFFL